MSDGLFKTILKSAAKAFAITLMICALISVIMLCFDLSEELLGYISLALIGLTCYLSAYFSTQRIRTKGLIQGLLCGVLIFLIVLILSVLTGKLSLSEQLPIKAIICIAFGIAGGVKGINTRHTKLHKFDSKLIYFLRTRH